MYKLMKVIEKAMSVLPIKVSLWIIPGMTAMNKSWRIFHSSYFMVMGEHSRFSNEIGGNSRKKETLGRTQSSMPL